MQTFETEHYIFHYGAGTAAERDIAKIAALQGEDAPVEAECADVTEAAPEAAPAEAPVEAPAEAPAEAPVQE